MHKVINIRKALNAFQVIKENGEFKKGSYELNGLTAETGFDGYTASIRDAHVRLDIRFHNTFSLSFNTNREKSLFLQKLNLLEQVS